MFDLTVQLRDDFIQRVFNELRRTASPFIQETFDEVAPIEVAGISVQPCVNVPDDVIPIVLVPESQSIELRLLDVPVQLKVADAVAGEDALHEMVVGFLITLPVESRIANERVQVGVDPTALAEDGVLVAIPTGHPLSDDDVLLVFLNRFVHDFIVNGSFALTQSFENQPLPGTGLEVSAFVRIVNNDGDPAGPIVRVEPTALSNQYDLVVPLEIWANIEPPNSDQVLQHLHFEAELRITVPVLRDLNPAQGEVAGVTILLPEAEAALTITNIIEGQQALDPATRGAIETFVRDRIGDLVRSQGIQRIDTFSLDQLIGMLRTLLRDTLVNDGRFVEVWGAPQSEEVRDATVRILDGVAAIGINGEPGSNLFSEEPFIPAERDFAIRLNADALIEQIEANLVAPDEYDDVAGNLSPFQPAFEGQSEIIIAGFTSQAGTIRRNTRFRLDGFVYTVVADAEIEPNDGGVNVAEVSITPELRNNVGIADRISIEFGVGLPITLDAGGWDRTFRINDDVSVAFEDDRIRLSGTSRLRRPHAVIRNIDASLAINIGLDWTSTAAVNGGGQTGATLAVNEVIETLREFPDNSLVVVDDRREPYRLTSATNVAGQSAELDLTPDISDSPADDAFVSLRWLRMGRVSGETQAGNTLQVADMTEGDGLIPAGAFVRVGDAAFRIDQDAAIEAGDRATLTLATSLSSKIEGGPNDGAAARLFGGWNGRATVDGADQTGNTLVLSNVVRTVPDGQTLTIAGMNGLFRVQGTTDIVNNQALLTLTHEAIDILDGLLGNVDPTELWSRIGQPEENASVRHRSGGQTPTLRRIGDVELSLETPLDGILGFLIGLVVGLIVPGGIVLRILSGLITGFIVRALVRRIFQGEANDFEIGEIVEAPFPDKLKDLGLVIDSVFNNPIAISPDGIALAGTATPATVFPDLPESRARAFGPYIFEAGIAGHFAGGTDAPMSEYLWLSGDGTVLAGLTPSHTYPRRGTYVADLSSVDNQLGLATRTRELAGILVRNSLPELGPLPVITGVEGTEIVLTVPFSDIAWLDTHTAIVDWGDDTLPSEAEITETLGPPQTTGSLTARHAYCDNGEFTVTVILTDAQGGTDRRTTLARIENVPPVVDAGEDTFAHPCVSLRLVGQFTDEGWCDTHTGIWDFGDCSPSFPATIAETNLPPRAVGTATATHCYTRCGKYLATLTITDDDGASASDSLVVRWSELLNGGFEGGFARHPLGHIGRHWDGYARPLSSSLENQAVFDCESCVVCEGARAQAVCAPGFAHAGLRQTFGVNPGWEYQIAAQFQLGDAGSSGWIGLDPLGGTDRDAEQIVWRAIEAAPGWQGLSNRVVAEVPALTVFIEVRSPGPLSALIDCVAMQAFPCPPDEMGPPESPPVDICVDWAAQQSTVVLGSEETFGGFTFRTEAGTPLRIVLFGLPAATGKLLIPDLDTPDVLLVELNGLYGAVRATVSGPPSQEISLHAISADGTELGTDASSAGDVRDLSVMADNIARVELRSGLRGTLVELCAMPSRWP